MHDVNMRTVHFGEGHQMMDAFGFDDGRPALMMPFRTGFAFGEQFLLQARHQIGIFAMRGGDDAKLLSPSCSVL